MSRGKPPDKKELRQGMTGEARHDGSRVTTHTSHASQTRVAVVAGAGRVSGYTHNTLSNCSYDMTCHQARVNIPLRTEKKHTGADRRSVVLPERTWQFSGSRFSSYEEKRRTEKNCSSSSLRSEKRIAIATQLTLSLGAPHAGLSSFFLTFARVVNGKAGLSNAA